MVVAIDIGISLTQSSKWVQCFFEEMVIHLSSTHNHVQVLLIEDTPSKKNKPLATLPLQKVYVNRSNWFANKKWQLWQLPSLVKKYGVDVFITSNVGPIIPSIRHWLLLPDGALIDFKKAARFSKYQKIITPSLHTKNKLAALHPSITTIEILNGAATLSPHQPQEVTKAAYTEGKEFFACNCHNEAACMWVLKAFSLFKKRQQTNRKLVLLHPPPKSILRKLETYKFKTDVVILPIDDAAQATVLSAAYALVYTGALDGWGQLLLQAVKHSVPIITTHAVPAQEYGGASVVLLPADTPDALANQLMQIYKDENGHKHLQQAAKEKAHIYTIPFAADRLWQLLTNA